MFVNVGPEAATEGLCAQHQRGSRQDHQASSRYTGRDVREAEHPRLHQNTGTSEYHIDIAI